MEREKNPPTNRLILWSFTLTFHTFMLSSQGFPILLVTQSEGEEE